MARDDKPTGDELASAPAPPAFSEPAAPGTAAWLDTSFSETRRLRKDGWDGAKMAMFCGTLAETGVVTDACYAAGMSAKSAYALRHRDPLFDQVWEAALSMARARLADELLARALKGSAEQILRDGCIVGERHHFDNKLAFAVLRRLDRRAELGATFRMPPASETPVPAPAVSGEWQNLLDAMTEDRTGDVARLVAPAPKGNTEGNDPPMSTPETSEFSHDRIWRTWQTGEWRTDYPPSLDFEGKEEGNWEDEDYCRALSDQELAALVAAGIAVGDARPACIDEDEAEREAFFEALLDPLPARDDQGGPTAAHPR